MNELFILAFVIMPIVVVAMGYTSLIVLDRKLRRERTDTPAE